MSQGQDLESRLRSRRIREYEPALEELRQMGPEVEPLLATLVVDPQVVPRVRLAVMLGDLRGDEGTAALREVARDARPGTRDLRSVALLALAKRCGNEATPYLVMGLDDRDPAVKDYAVLGLAGAGDDRGWQAVFDRLRTVLRRGSRVFGHTEILVAVAYLAQHMDGHPDRKHALVRELRRRWSSLTAEEAGWFLIFWPEARPDGPDPEAVRPPEAARLRSWVRESFFRNETYGEDARPEAAQGVLARHTPVQLLTDRFESQGVGRGAVGVVVDEQGSGYEIQIIEEDGWGPLVGPVPASDVARHGP